METISITGLGYVGLPIAVAFARKLKVIAYDANRTRVEELKLGRDKNGEVEKRDINFENIVFTSDPAELAQANFHIVAVPTPIDKAKRPDLTLLKNASQAIGRILKKGDTVVFESTVYPGATEEVCLPILEEISNLSCPQDFSIGYSPERINPGDKEHQLHNIVKVVAGSTPEVTQRIAETYGEIVEAGVHSAPSIKVAEAAKVIENTQRDLNIALMNELAIIFDRLGIDTADVLDAAGTKWNFLPFKPGLVGGHCIGVDPYYLTHKAEELDYHPQVILAGRRINDNVYKYIVEKTVKLIHSNRHISATPKIGMLGVTFKENCPDIRNSKAFHIVEDLKEYGFDLLVHDPVADPQETLSYHNLELASLDSFKQLDVLIVAVAHDTYRHIDKNALAEMLKDNGVVIDIKGLFDRTLLESLNLNFWRL